LSDILHSQVAGGLCAKPMRCLIIAADAGEERTFLEQVRDHSSDLRASSTDIILIIVADAGEERISLEQASEHGSGLLTSSTKTA